MVENRRGSSDSDKPESSKVLVIVKLVLLLEKMKRQINYKRKSNQKRKLYSYPLSFKGGYPEYRWYAGQTLCTKL
jgi:hypothetical protein